MQIQTHIQIQTKRGRQLYWVILSCSTPVTLEKEEYKSLS